MTDTLVLVLTCLFLLASALMAWRFVTRRQDALASARPIETPDGLQIPVYGIFTRGGGFVGGSQHNSLTPRFTVGPDAIRFKAVSTQQWAFSEIAHVEAKLRRKGSRLLFVHRGGGVLVVDVIGEANVLAALRALPDYLALTPQAAVLRNGTAATATPGLREYSGPMR